MKELAGNQAAVNAALVVLALVVTIAAVVAVATYRAAKRREAAQWMHQLFQRFELAPEYGEAKQVFEFQYRDVVEPLLGGRIVGRPTVMLPFEWERCQLVDRVLAHLEHLRYLAGSGNARQSDCVAYFRHWFNLLNDPERGALRRYLVRAGYRRLAEYTRAAADDYLLLYGTLSSDAPKHQAFGLDRRLKRIGYRDINGQLYDMGDYPALVPGDGVVRMELFRIRDLAVLEELDEYEEYDRTRLKQSAYRRTTVRIPRFRNALLQRMAAPRVVDAWIYVYNQPVGRAERVRHPSWQAHRAAGKGSAAGSVRQPPTL
ncbi:MAG TPA: gamma-glutamylcyclotransferase family protein [Gammaproteobacteria bacterium]|nr:gamma-glutamylcyclotransferase family protein [Gammaproteobacteria bacterium]